MNIVVDTNILFSSLLSEHSRQRKMLLSNRHAFYAPNYVFVELFKHKEKIIRNAKASEVEVYEYLTMLLKHIHFVHPGLISRAHRHTAYLLCQDVDPEDILLWR